MILLREQNVLFLKPVKTAGTSFEIALSKFAGPDDIITPVGRDHEKVRRKLGYRTAQNHGNSIFDQLRNPLKLRVKSNEPKFYNHMPAEEAREILGPSRWGKLLKISIVRNPFDRLVSHYFMAKSNDPKVKDIASWARNRPRALGKNEQFYFIDGKSVLDLYIRYEHFATDIRRLEELRPGLTGLYDAFAGLSANSDFRKKSSNYWDFYSEHPKLIDAVKFFNQRTIEKFGYEFGEGASSARPA